MIKLVRFGFRGASEAFRVQEDGKDIGTISRYNAKSKWQAWAGIGPACKFLGTFEARLSAVNAVAIGIPLLEVAK